MKDNKFSKNPKSNEPNQNEKHKPQQPMTSQQERPSHFPSNWPKKKER